MITGNLVASGGVGLTGVLSPEEEKTKQIDQRALSRVIEFCEREGYDVGRHYFEPHESI
jgi:hypothetical protein